MGKEDSDSDSDSDEDGEVEERKERGKKKWRCQKERIIEGRMIGEIEKKRNIYYLLFPFLF